MITDEQIAKWKKETQDLSDRMGDRIDISIDPIEFSRLLTERDRLIADRERLREALKSLSWITGYEGEPNTATGNRQLCNEALAGFK